MAVYNNDSMDFEMDIYYCTSTRDSIITPSAPVDVNIHPSLARAFYGKDSTSTQNSNDTPPAPADVDIGRLTASLATASSNDTTNVQNPPSSDKMPEKRKRVTFVDDAEEEVDAGSRKHKSTPSTASLHDMTNTQKSSRHSTLPTWTDLPGLAGYYEAAQEAVELPATRPESGPLPPSLPPTHVSSISTQKSSDGGWGYIP
jgi:hypothetical protein